MVSFVPSACSKLGLLMEPALISKQIFFQSHFAIIATLFFYTFVEGRLSFSGVITKEQLTDVMVTLVGSGTLMTKTTKTITHTMAIQHSKCNIIYCNIVSKLWLVLRFSFPNTQIPKALVFILASFAFDKLKISETN